MASAFLSPEEAIQIAKATVWPLRNEALLLFSDFIRLLPTVKCPDDLATTTCNLIKDVLKRYYEALNRINTLAGKKAEQLALTGKVYYEDNKTIEQIRKMCISVSPNLYSFYTYVPEAPAIIGDELNKVTEDLVAKYKALLNAMDNVYYRLPGNSEQQKRTNSILTSTHNQPKQGTEQVGGRSHRRSTRRRSTRRRSTRRRSTRRR